MATQRNDYYTYAYLREDRTPYYIGKGRGYRIYSRQRLIKPPDDKSRIIFLKKNLTEEEAFKHEIYMIAIFGRKDLGTGILRNLTNGGDGVSGIIHSAERKQAQAERMAAKGGALHPMYGVPRTAAQKKTQSEKMTGRFLGALNPCSKAIIAIKPDGTELHFGSGREAARELGVPQGNFSPRNLTTGHVLAKGNFKGWAFQYE